MASKCPGSDTPANVVPHDKDTTGMNPDSSDPRMFVVTVQFSVDPQHLDAFMREMVANARDSRQREPGCLAFDVCQDASAPEQVFLYEIYRDAAAFEQHKREAHFLAFDRTVAPWVRHKAIRTLALVDR